MKKIVFLLMLCCATTFYGQSKVTYGYDAAGNRVKREIVLARAEKSEEINNPEIYSEMLEEHSISISPNPTVGQITVKISNLNNNEGHIAIYGVSGSLIERTNVLSKENSFDLSSQSKGVYIIQIRIDGKDTTWKIIKE